jgi:hypothetical protein
VKPQKGRFNTSKTHKDLLILVNFCKDILDNKNVKPVIAVQAVGKFEVKYQFLYDFTYYTFFLR